MSFRDAESVGSGAAKRVRLGAGILIALAVWGAGRGAWGAEKSRSDAATAADIEVQYEAVLAAMKQPGATGVLVTEIGPFSAAGAAGLRGGDIITELAGVDVRTLPALRQRVADLLASTVVEEHPAPVALTVKRQAPAKRDGTPGEIETITLKIPREPLGIRAIEVTANVAAELNPPASARGSMTMAWEALRKLQTGGGDLGGKNFFRVNDSEGHWLGWQERTATPVSDDTLAGALEVSHVGKVEDDWVVTATESIRFTLRTGDYKTAPAFVLDGVELVEKPGDQSTVTTTLARAGNILRTTSESVFPTRIEGPFKHERPYPMNALTPAAISLVAAAMPREKDAVLAVSLMSARDFIPRPGYVLAARGKRNMPAVKDAAVEQAWQVDLMHCGILVETYWLDDNRRLLRIDSYSGSTLTARRVANETEARVRIIAKPKPVDHPMP